MKKLNRIKGALADARRTNLWLAEQERRNPETISKWCTNTSQPGLNTLFKIVNFLHLNPGKLLVKGE
ncbi:hypothetical protein A9168_01590 [Macellibacteroides sp. HH-ZS]|nr:hypothetical protein A9168_01590 [Macellibacteroides sp. HH-ZS]